MKDSKMIGMRNTKRIIDLPLYEDERGILLPVDHAANLPFKPERTFIVCNVPVGTKRGGHAHYKCEQYAIVVNGMIRFELFDGLATETTILYKGESILMPKMIWDTQHFLTADAILLVFCSTHYDRLDYINDLEQFKQLTRR